MLKCVESEAHLLFECVTTRHVHSKLHTAMADEADLLRHGTADHKLRMVIASPNLEVWGVLGEVSYRIWCRPRQAWRRHGGRSSWRHTESPE
jgi:hypothetical protein